MPLEVLPIKVFANPSGKASWVEIDGKRVANLVNAQVTIKLGEAPRLRVDVLCLENSTLEGEAEVICSTPCPKCGEVVLVKADRKT